MPRTFIVGHDEITKGVRQAMVDQLRRDGELRPGMEIGLIFYSSDPQDMRVDASVLLEGGGSILISGNRNQISRVIKNIVAAKLGPEAKKYKPAAEVHFQSNRSTDKNGDTEDAFFALVELEEKESVA